jgi:holo-[acyl-carrier protein] synthase
MIKGIGVDIIDIPRIKRMIEKNNRFTEKVFSASEIAYCRSKYRQEVHFAARFAAKEAYFKALGTGWRYGMRWQDISVENDELGKPEIKLSGIARDYFEENQFQHVHLSISHAQSYAVAFVVVE